MEVVYRKRFKSFLCLPRSIPNTMEKEMCGNFEELVKRLEIAIETQEMRN